METQTIFYLLGSLIAFVISGLILRWIFDISIIVKNQNAFNEEITKIRKSEERIIELLETQNRLISKTLPKD